MIWTAKPGMWVRALDGGACGRVDAVDGTSLLVTRRDTTQYSYPKGDLIPWEPRFGEWVVLRDGDDDRPMLVSSGGGSVVTLVTAGGFNCMFDVDRLQPLSMLRGGGW